MRIIAGRHRRKSLQAPKGYLTRPTTDRTRESLFNLVDSRMDLEGADVLDLFAGTGALGLEAVSRGAASVVFVENNAEVLKYTRRNAASLDTEEACWFIRSDVLMYLSRYEGPPFDLVLADPPYELDRLTDLPDLVLPHVKPDGLFVLEHDARHSFSEHPLLNVSRPYGRTIVSVFRPPAGDEVG
jgi:16S rRNA (guanine(966)-N(2))-methyltransferase RsmD